MKSLIGDKHKAAILESIPKGGTMLEWGGGGSTKWFLDRMGFDRELHTVEHDPMYASLLRGECSLRPNWTLHEVYGRYAVGANATVYEELPAGWEQYILPSGVDMRDVDVFLVDGIARGACLCSAMANARQGAVIWLHDCGRDWYHWPLRIFRARWARWEDMPEDGPDGLMRIQR